MCIRVQRKRTKGWKMPPNTKYVGRGTAWGNPLKLEGDMIYIDASYRRDKLMDGWLFLCKGDRTKAVRLYEMVLTNTAFTGEYGIDLDMFRDILHWINYFKTIDVKALKGYNLSCFCKEGEICHADILLKHANK